MQISALILSVVCWFLICYLESILFIAIIIAMLSILGMVLVHISYSMFFSYSIHGKIIVVILAVFLHIK
jgi:hypothetical protein